jgi:UDP-N-acetylglucosamine 4,6-dehydratase/5-epimerase
MSSELFDILKGATLLVTGGTGSFGKKFIRTVLEKSEVQKIVVYSRDELKQWEMSQEMGMDPRLRFFVGDVRDRERLYRAFEGIDFVVHAAALKIVPVAEYNPFEAIKTNVLGAMNVIDGALDAGVKRVVALSTDKACNPINLYGATKLCSDKLFIASNAYSGGRGTRFSVVRYGNVMGSRGSVIPHFMRQRDAGEIFVTDERMTRFMITLEQGVDIVLHALREARGGEIYVKKIPSMKVVDIAQAIAPAAKVSMMGIRPGEKLHEQMISVEDARTTVEFEDHFVIYPQIELVEGQGIPPGGNRCPEGFCYSSETNAQWMSQGELRSWAAESFGDLRPKTTEKKIEEALQTTIISLDRELPKGSALEQILKQVVQQLEQGDRSQALTILRGAGPQMDDHAQLYFLMAQIEAGENETHGAISSLLRLLQRRPDHTEGRTLLRALGGKLGLENVFDLN